MTLVRLRRARLPRPISAPPGQHHALVGAVLLEPCQAPAHELVDVAVVVGEQDPVAARCASRCPCSARGGAASSRRARRRTGRAGAARLRPPPIGRPPPRRRRAESSGVGKWRASSLAVTPRPGDLLDALEHVGIGDLLRADVDLDLGAVLGHQRRRAARAGSCGSGADASPSWRRRPAAGTWRRRAGCAASARPVGRRTRSSG